MTWTFQAGIASGSFVSGSTSPFLLIGLSGDRRGLTIFNHTAAIGMF